MIVRKMAYLTKNAPFYSIDSKRHMTTLPKYQNLKVVKEENGYLHVIVDGVHGYVDASYAKALSKTCVIIDLQRQTLRVFQKGNEVYRAHIISGRKSMPTEIGCFKIGHRLRDYQLTPNNFVKYWIQYNHNQGIHDASWQKKENFIKVSKEAYQNYAKGLNITYPYKYGSHGCDNMEEIDARVVYDLVHVGDNVLVIGPNNLVVDNLVSMVNTLRNEHFDFGLEKKLVKTFKTC